MTFKTPQTKVILIQAAFKFPLCITLRGLDRQMIPERGTAAATYMYINLTGITIFPVY